MTKFRPMLQFLLVLLVLLLTISCTGSPVPVVGPKETHAGPLAQVATASSTSTAESCPDAGGGARFAVYGDTRSDPIQHQKVVDAVLKANPAWVLQTGDLVDDGCDEFDWAKFDEITRGLRERKIPFYPARGNHDFRCSADYYEERVAQPICSGNKLYYSFRRGNLHFVSIDTETDLRPASEQGRWLEKDLAQAQAAGRLIIPFFHKAIYSVGRHAEQDDVLALRPTLTKLFSTYGVRLAFEGHDHIYYRTVRGDTTYVVTGGGGAPLYGKEHPKIWQEKDVFHSVYHFCIVEIFDDRLVVTAYDADGKEIDRFPVELTK
jgi:3',5'-cyclic AMP phosphodiesterase CpdA